MQSKHNNKSSDLREQVLIAIKYCLRMNQRQKSPATIATMAANAKNNYCKGGSITGSSGVTPPGLANVMGIIQSTGMVTPCTATQSTSTVTTVTSASPRIVSPSPSAVTPIVLVKKTSTGSSPFLSPVEV